MGRRILTIYEEPRVFAERPDGAVFRRTGSCNRCGSCCRTGDPFDGGRGVPVVEGACVLYREEDGIGRCTDRDHPYAVNACSIWPTDPRHLTEHPTCSYRFERIQ